MPAMAADFERLQAWEARARRAAAPPAAVLSAAGNQSVARFIEEAGSALAGGIEALAQLASGEITASVGRRGQNRPADVAVVRSLLVRAGFDQADLEDAIERYQRERLGWARQDARVDPGGKTLRALKREGGSQREDDGDGGRRERPPAPVPDGGGGASRDADGGGSSRPGPAPSGEHVAEVHRPPPVSGEPLPDGDPAREQSERVFREFASAREPLFAAMRSATEDDARREATRRLRAFDAEHLPELRRLQATLGGRWDIKDAAARDAVLAAIQLEAATDAEGDLLNDSREVHRRVAAASGMGIEHAWCGMFTVDHYRHSGMDRDLTAGFLHVDNVHDFFTYRHDRNPRRVPRWIWADHKWQDLRTYHEERGAEREWLPGEEVWAGGELDIRPGDTVLIDHKGDGEADHIVKAASYDPATSTLITMGGNDGGFVLDRRSGGRARGNAAKRERAEGLTGSAMTTEAMRGGAAGGHVGVSVHKVTADGKKRGTIFGVGRPSLVDFEDHPYDRSNNVRRPPPPLKE